jgi:hypothetical protein
MPSTPQAATAETRASEPIHHTIAQESFFTPKHDWQQYLLNCP